MKKHEAEAIFALVEHMRLINFTGMSIEAIKDGFMLAVADKPDTSPPKDTPANDDWGYRFLPHPEARIPGSQHRGKGYYALFMFGAPTTYIVSTHYESFAQQICRAMNKHKQCEKLLRQILDEVTTTLDAPIGRTNVPMGLDYRSLQHIIRELLK